MFAGVDPDSYYFYHGSHTHPKHGDCSESVDWVIMQDPIRITKETVKRFHREQVLIVDFRPKTS